jgi:hypothetical protein
MTSNVFVRSSARDHIQTGLLGIVENTLDVMGAVLEVESILGMFQKLRANGFNAISSE